MNRSKSVQRTILAWMPPGANKRQQILGVALVPLQKGIPISLYAQILDQMDCKIHYLLEKALKEEPAARRNLLNRLDSMGLLPEEARDKKLTSWQLSVQLMESELRMYIRPEVEKDLKEPVEVPGARELYENLTLYQWLDALEEEVSGRWLLQQGRPTF